MTKRSAFGVKFGSQLHSTALMCTRSSTYLQQPRLMGIVVFRAMPNWHKKHDIYERQLKPLKVMIITWTHRALLTIFRRFPCASVQESSENHSRRKPWKGNLPSGWRSPVSKCTWCIFLKVTVSLQKGVKLGLQLLLAPGPRGALIQPWM